MVGESKKDNLKKLISYKTKYYKRRHVLSTETSNKMKKEFYKPDLNLFETKYEEFKKLVRKESKKVSDYTGEEFYNKMKEIYS